MKKITYLHRFGADLVGYIPEFLSLADPRAAAEQFDENYAHGGGWRPMPKWEHGKAPKGLWIRYPGDGKLTPVALIEFREEKIWVYRGAWVAIEKADGTVEVSRMD